MNQNHSDSVIKKCEQDSLEKSHAQHGVFPKLSFHHHDFKTNVLSQLKIMFELAMCVQVM